jgi:hypothetical protein
MRCALGLAHGRKGVVRGQGVAHLRRADVERGHAVGLQPGADGEGAAAQDLGALHAIDGGQARLDNANQIVGDLIVLQDGRAEGQVHRGGLRVGWLQADGRYLGFGGKSARTWFTRVLMSARALAPSKLSFRRTLMVDRPCTLCDSM